MGSGRKRKNVFQDESQQTDRRRSSRILALEEKRESEKERENESANYDINRDKGKGKETLLLCDHFISDYEQNSPTNNKGLAQLIPSTQEGQHPENGSTSKTNGNSSLNGMPQKQVLEFVLDVLQRNDPEELFAEPVNPNVVGNYYRIVKQPMDFSTMRAKLQEGMYTSMEQFKRDVYLLCINAMNVNLANTRRHQVAETIFGLAKKVFEDISGVDPQHFVLQSSTNKNPPAVVGGKPQGGLPKTTGHARFRLNSAWRNIDTHCKALEIEKKDKYWLPNDKSLCSEVLNAPKPNLQLNKNAGNYRESLLRYTEGLGPTAQAVAAKKLEELKFKQLVHGTANLGNVVDTKTSEARAETEAAAKSLEGVKNFKQNWNNESRTLNLLGKVSERQKVEERGVTEAGRSLESEQYALLLNSATQAPNLLLQNMNNGIPHFGGSTSKVKVWPTQVISGPQPKPPERKPYINHPPMFERLIWPQTNPTSIYSSGIPILQSMIMRMRNNPSSSASPSQVARWANPNTCLYQGGDMQGLLRPTTHFNPSHQYMNPIGPLFPQQEPRSTTSSLLFPQQEEARPSSSSSALQLMPLGSELSKWEERQLHQPQHKQQLLPEDEDDKDLNLALQL